MRFLASLIRLSYPILRLLQFFESPIQCCLRQLGDPKSPNRTSKASSMFQIVLHSCNSLLRCISQSSLFVQGSALKILPIPNLEHLDIWIPKLPDDCTSTLVKLNVKFNGFLPLFV